MEFISENRYRMKEVLSEIQTRKIISFSPIKLELLRDVSLMVIINSQQYKNHPFFIPSKWDVRLNNKIHSKLAIGLKGFVIGSWNFSDNSSNMMHESILKVDYESAPILQKELADYFEKIWNRSTPIKQ